MNTVLSNPDIQNQLWGLVSVGVLWLLGKAASWIKGQLSDSQQADLDKMENFARDAGAWALVHFPGLSLDDLASKGADELRAILARQGFKFSDDTWNHLSQIMRGFITAELLARQSAIAAKVGPAPLPPVSGTIAK